MGQVLEILKSILKTVVFFHTLRKFIPSKTRCLKLSQSPSNKNDSFHSNVKIVGFSKENKILSVTIIFEVLLGDIFIHMDHTNQIVLLFVTVTTSYIVLYCGKYGSITVYYCLPWSGTYHYQNNITDISL